MADRPLPQIWGALCPAPVRILSSCLLYPLAQGEMKGVGLEKGHTGEHGYCHMLLKYYGGDWEDAREEAPFL